mgnify:CR=1 FL=1
MFTLKRDGGLDLCHSSGWRHFNLEKEQEKNVIQIQRNGKRKLFSQNKMFMVAYMIFAEPAETSYYLPKSLVIKKSLLKMVNKFTKNRKKGLKKVKKKIK